jgi:hypothetical protein
MSEGYILFEDGDELDAEAARGVIADWLNGLTVEQRIALAEKLIRGTERKIV